MAPCAGRSVQQPTAEFNVPSAVPAHLQFCCFWPDLGAIDGADLWGATSACHPGGPARKRRASCVRDPPGAGPASYAYVEGRTFMFNVIRKEITWGGRRLILETGKLARQADG